MRFYLLGLAVALIQTVPLTNTTVAAPFPAAPRETASDGLKAILAPDARLEKIVDGCNFTEGPVWLRDKGILIFSDIPESTLYRYLPATGTKEVFRRPSFKTNGNTLDRENRLISCEHESRRVSRTALDGTVTTLAERFENKRLNSPNDVVVKSDGAIYFTDPPYGIKKEQEELGFQAVYRIDPKTGALSAPVRDFKRPNGLAFSPDEKRLYVNDMGAHHIRVFDVQKDGTLSNSRLFAAVELPGQPKWSGTDGMKVDTKGNIYCTSYGGVWVFAANGTRLGIIETLGKNGSPGIPSNVAFGEKDAKTLYITQNEAVYRIRLQNVGIRPGPR
ncbi:MAG: SMP-30/gluconolactonase/LRE family protein [Cytophagales bacterium]|nr:SMP-30/gluconolactonase/LRE family protein [Armatimonadota bacterium]